MKIEHEPPIQGIQADRLSARALGTADIVFMVIAAAAPMAVTVSMAPMAFALGNGAGVTVSWLFSLCAMLLFAIGYVRIIPYVRNAGAFYAYITAAIGRNCGLGAAYVAALSYFALSTSTLGALAFFSEQLFEHLSGHHLHWAFWGAIEVSLIAWLSYRQIKLAASVLGVALLAEIAVLGSLDVRILFHLGFHGLDFSVLSPKWLLAPGLGITSIFTFNSMIGIEGTAIYQEEARDSAVTVPRATYISLGIVGLFYVVTAWCLTMAVGAGHVAAAARASPNTFVMDRCVEYLGSGGGMIVGIFGMTSMFAATLGLSNNCARYLFALARDGVLPRAFAHTHPTYKSPHVAGLSISAGLMLVLVGTLLLGLDPLMNLQNAMAGLGSVGLMTLLGVTALIIPIYFVRNGGCTIANSVAPAIGGVAILVATVFAVGNYSSLTGLDSPAINHLPYLLLVVAAIGVVQAHWIRVRWPDRFALIGATRVDG